MTAAPSGLRRPSVISVGVSVILVSVVILPALPMALPAVCVWWLADDLLRNQHRRPSGLGWAALALFSVAAVGGVATLLTADARAACGASIFGGVDNAGAGLDDACVSARLWRPVVGASLAMVVCAIGAISVPRSDPRTPPIAVAARTFGAMIAVIVVITLALVFT